jgi:hypothetical protein
LASKASRYAVASSISLTTLIAPSISLSKPRAAFPASSQPSAMASNAGFAPFMVSFLNSSNLLVSISICEAALRPFKPSSDTPSALASSFNLRKESLLARST